MKKEIKQKEEKDYRIGQRVLATLVIEDKGQDFTELDVLENGVLLGNNPIFTKGRLSILGIGTLDGMVYHTFQEIRANSKLSLNGLFIYLKDTHTKKEPLPWKASTLNYKIIGKKKAVKPNRFIKK